MKTLRHLLPLLAAALLCSAAPAKDEAPLIAGPYVPSPDSAVAAMLREADVGPDDYVIDLGSGDGRIVRTAALVFGARGMGVEIETTWSGCRTSWRRRRASPSVRSSSPRTCSGPTSRRHRGHHLPVAAHGEPAEGQAARELRPGARWWCTTTACPAGCRTRRW